MQGNPRRPVRRSTMVPLPACPLGGSHPNLAGRHFSYTKGPCFQHLSFRIRLDKRLRQEPSCVLHTGVGLPSPRLAEGQGNS